MSEDVSCEEPARLRSLLGNRQNQACEDTQSFSPSDEMGENVENDAQIFTI